MVVVVMRGKMVVVVMQHIIGEVVNMMVVNMLKRIKVNGIQLLSLLNQGIA